jgi:acetyl esterase/lipase
VRNPFSTICLLIGGACLALASQARADDAPPTLQRDIVYATIDSLPLTLDLATPAQGAGPFPLVVCIHGGAWHVGDKSKFDPVITHLAQNGYVAATVNYRFAPHYQFPAQLDDVRAAVEFLRAHSAQYHIDPKHVAAYGESAGAHLALLLGLMDDLPAATADKPLVKVQCVVSYDAPTDLAHYDVPALTRIILKEKFHLTIDDYFAQLLGKDDIKDKLTIASPITYVSKNSPPVITFHGTLDPIVPLGQAQRLHDALKAAGVSEELVKVVGGAHCNWQGEQRAQTDQQALDFLDKYLKGVPGDQPQAKNSLDKPLQAAN